MFLADLFEATAKTKVVVLLPGGYHPFHPGHLSLYKAALAKYPNADIYLVSTNDTKERPFPFEIKQRLAAAAGVPPERFVQVKSPFVAKEVTSNYDPENTVLIFARSEKDRDEQPKPGGIKKDGSPAYLQPAGGKIEPMSKHGYVDYLPTIQFKAGPKNFTSASEIRANWPASDKNTKTQIVQDLYPNLANDPKKIAVVVKILDQVLNGNLAESGNAKIPGLNAMLKKAHSEFPTAKNPELALAGYAVRQHQRDIEHIEAHDQKDDEDLQRLDKENNRAERLLGKLVKQDKREQGSIQDLYNLDASQEDKIRRLNSLINSLEKKISSLKEQAGVGKIASAKEKNDPRYSMSLTKDVRPDTMKKQLAAFRLEESKKKSVLPEVKLHPVDEMALKSYTTVGDFDKPGPFRGADKRLIPHPKSEIKTAKFFSKTPFDFKLFFANVPGTQKYRETGAVNEAQLREMYPKHADQFLADHDDAITVIFVGNFGDRAVVMTPWIMAHRIGHAIQASRRREPQVAHAWVEAENHFFRTINDIIRDFYGHEKTNKPNAYIRQTLNREYNVNWDLQAEYNALFRAIGTQRSSRTGQIFRPYEFLYELFAQYLGTGNITLNPLPQSLGYGKKVFGKSTQFLRAQNIDQSELSQVTEILARDMEFLFDDVLSSCVGEIFVM